VHFAVEFEVVVGLIGGGELPVVIVKLARGGEITFGVEIKGERFRRVGVVSESGPVFGMKAGWIDGEWRVGLDGLIAGEDAAAEEAIAVAVGGELEVAVEIAVADAFFEGGGNVCWREVMTPKRS
jgi:hypothetical protein